MNHNKLQTFRQKVYEHLGGTRDVLFELMDAVMLTRQPSSLAELSTSPVFRRGWNSIYAGLRNSCTHSAKLKRVCLEQVPTQSRPLLAGDHTCWPRLHARTLKERTYEHQGTAPWNQKPVTVGQGYSTLVWIPEEKGSWALPLSHERITSFETPSTKAAWQLRQACKHLKARPIGLWDSEYGNANFVEKTADIPCDKLIRIRTNRNVWREPPPYSGRGRPRIHGAKFKLNDESTWCEPARTLEVNDPCLGKVRVQQWDKVHFRQTPKHPMSLIRIERLEHPKSQPLWVVWIAEEEMPLEMLWSKYLERFAVDHWYRFAKQRLHWLLPQLTDVKACECWSELMPLIMWQLWLAREMAWDNPLPWQKPQGAKEMTPGRVAQGMGGVLAVLGTPARPPKPRGKSPGWPKGKKREAKPRYPVVKKGYKGYKKRRRKKK